MFLRCKLQQKGPLWLQSSRYLKSVLEYVVEHFENMIFVDSAVTKCVLSVLDECLATVFYLVLCTIKISHMEHMPSSMC